MSGLVVERLSMAKLSQSKSQVARSFLYQQCNEMADNVIGRILTLTDAIAKDEVQRKAMKDLVQQSVWSTTHSTEINIGYFCDDLQDLFGEKNETSATVSPAIKRLSIFEE